MGFFTHDVNKVKKIKGVIDKIGEFNGRCEYALNALLLCLYKTTQLGLVTRTAASNTNGDPL